VDIATTMLLPAGLCVVGAALGVAANVAAFRLALSGRPIGPWAIPPEGAPPRRPADRVPILGWIGLRRESPQLGSGYWIRPMLVELFCALGLCALYAWEVLAGGLQPASAMPLPPPDPAVLHLQFAVHAVLMWLMLVVSLIDADEQYVPDSLTVSGALLGLGLAAFCPWSLLPVEWLEFRPPQVGFLRLSSPEPWPGGLDGSPNLGPLAFALACWWLWCFALMDRRWRLGRGMLWARRIFCARLQREPSTGRLLVLGTAGTPVVLGIWLVGGFHWMGLLSSLTGLAVGGGLIWVVRWFGWVALRREAMGFGDVILLGMIGTFLGWQACIIVFFLAPLAGVVVGLVSLLSGRSNVVPYGPFLCLASLATIVLWADAWAFLEIRLQWLGFWLPLLIGLALVAMIPMLYLIRKVRELLVGPPPGA
jgi:leader peptidase (prepilin peptidase)/N-methyltransferase